MTVAELSKPGGTWCTHATSAKAAGFTRIRPQSCSVFFCVYSPQCHAGEHWKPSHSRMVVTRDTGRINIIVDPSSDAWRKEPYHSDLKKWAASFALQQTIVAVTVGETITIVLPIATYRSASSSGKMAKLVSRPGRRACTTTLKFLDAPPAPRRADLRTQANASSSVFDISSAVRMTLAELRRPAWPFACRRFRSRGRGGGKSPLSSARVIFDDGLAGKCRSFAAASAGDNPQTPVDDVVGAAAKRASAARKSGQCHRHRRSHVVRSAEPRSLTRDDWNYFDLIQMRATSGGAPYWRRIVGKHHGS